MRAREQRKGRQRNRAFLYPDQCPDRQVVGRWTNDGKRPRRRRGRSTQPRRRERPSATARSRPQPIQVLLAGRWEGSTGRSLPWKPRELLVEAAESFDFGADIAPGFHRRPIGFPDGSPDLLLDVNHRASAVLLEQCQGDFVGEYTDACHSHLSVRRCRKPSSEERASLSKTERFCK